MINEDRVKELSRMAIYDKNEDKVGRQAGRFYRRDYITKELIKSFFAGTLLYVMILALLVLDVGNSLLDQLNSMDYFATVTLMAVTYIVFLAIYLLVTFLVCYLRYTDGRRRLKQYYAHLAKVSKGYSREDAIKGGEKI